jgi:hypothetical protein
VRAVGPCGTSAFSSSDAGSRVAVRPAPPEPQGHGRQLQLRHRDLKASSGATGYQAWRTPPTRPTPADRHQLDAVLRRHDRRPRPLYYYWVRPRTCGTSGFSNRDRGNSIQCP